MQRAVQGHPGMGWDDLEDIAAQHSLRVVSLLVLVNVVYIFCNLTAHFVLHRAKFEASDPPSLLDDLCCS